jgi:hypothetical protein
MTANWPVIIPRTSLFQVMIVRPIPVRNLVFGALEVLCRFLREFVHLKFFFLVDVVEIHYALRPRDALLAGRISAFGGATRYLTIK